MLPAGWAQYSDPTTGNPYYHNAATGETTWTQPTEAPMFGLTQPAMAQATAALFQPAFNPLLAVAAMQPLPAGWAEHTDLASGNKYYHNVGTGETTWTRPALPLLGQAGVHGSETWIDGTVKNWDDEKGFGFIDPVGGGDNVFVHRSALGDGQKLEKGSSVKYVVSWNAQKNKHQVAKCQGAKPGAGGPPGTAPAAAFPAPLPAEGEQGTGVVKTWFDDKGFGFIAPSDGSKDCYVHRTFLLDGESLTVGSTVSYTIEYDAAKNKNNATKCSGALKTGSGPAGSNQQAPGLAAPMAAFGAAFGAVPGAMNTNVLSPYAAVPT